MIIPAHLNYFTIEECGLYRHGDNVPKGLLSAETFEAIYKWVQGKPMEETIPWDPRLANSGSAKCYCHDIYRCEDTDEYLLVLWKSDADSNGSVWGAQATAPTGQSSVVEYTDNYRGRKIIWGKPCYYWIIPKLRTVISIKLDHSVCDSGLFQDWVTKCITNRVQHADKKKSETETGQIRFEFSDASQPALRYAFRFDVRLRSLDTGSTQMQDLAARVTHIIRRDTVKVGMGIDERPTWVKIFDQIPLLPTKPKAKSRQIEVRAEAKPSAAEIKSIIEKFSREERKRSDWNNVGFATEDGVVWVDKYRLHETINFNKDASTVFTASDIFERLSSQREKLLKSVIADERAPRAAISARAKK